MNYKIHKYIGKIQEKQKSCYLRKIAFYLTQNYQTGGNIVTTDIKSVLNKLQEIYDKTPKTTTKKYVVFLYAPPASGKTLAKKLAFSLIKKFFEKDMEITDIENSFIDTNVDDITYDVETETGKTVKELLLENINKKVASFSEAEELNYIKKNIDELAKESFNIYYPNRKKADPISELLHYFAILFDKNILIEISSPDINYIDKVARTANWYGYNPIIVYPFVSQLHILMDRVIKRGLNEGRIITCDSPHGIKEKMLSMLTNYNSLKKVIIDNKSYDNYIIIQYNSDIPIDDYNKLNKYDFSIFDKYIMDVAFKTTSKKIEEVVSKRIIDYQAKTKISADC